MKNKISLKVGVVVLLSAIIMVWGYRFYLIKELRGVVLNELSEFTKSRVVVIENERIFGDWTLKNSIMCGEFYFKGRTANNRDVYKFVATPSYAYNQLTGLGKNIEEASMCDDELPDPERVYNKWWHMKW